MALTYFGLMDSKTPVNSARLNQVIVIFLAYLGYRLRCESKNPEFFKPLIGNRVFYMEMMAEHDHGQRFGHLLDFILGIYGPFPDDFYDFVSRFEIVVDGLDDPDRCHLPQIARTVEEDKVAR